MLDRGTADHASTSTTRTVADDEDEDEDDDSPRRLDLPVAPMLPVPPPARLMGVVASSPALALAMPPLLVKASCSTPGRLLFSISLPCNCRPRSMQAPRSSVAGTSAMVHLPSRSFSPSMRRVCCIVSNSTKSKLFRKPTTTPWRVQ